MFFSPSIQHRKQFLDVLQLCSGMVFIPHVHLVAAAVTVLLGHHHSPTVTLPSTAATYVDIYIEAAEMHLRLGLIHKGASAE